MTTDNGTAIERSSDDDGPALRRDTKEIILWMIVSVIVAVIVSVLMWLVISQKASDMSAPATGDLSATHQTPEGR